MFLIDFLPPRSNPLWALARQMGVTHCVVKAAPEVTGLAPPYEPGVLARIQADLAAAGLILIGLEGDPFDMSRIKLGRTGCAEDLDRYVAMLQEMGQLNLRLLCYNFMGGIGWHRSNTSVRGRGGALVSSFELDEESRSLTATGEITPEVMWRNYTRFITAIVPAARAAGVRLGAHPDDPPLPTLRGIARILNSSQQFERVLALSPDPHHGLTFCQANWKLMCGPDGPETQSALAANIQRFTATGRVNFVHLRDVRGEAAHFEETFHDDGPTNLASTLQLYHEGGFRGPVRCDHVPTLTGETNSNPGYGTLGRLFANGYILGLMDALGIRTDPAEWLDAR